MDYNDEPMTYALDFDPEIFGGVSMTEFGLIVKVAAGISFISMFFLSTAIAIYYSRYVIIFGTFPAAALLTFGLSFYGMVALGKLKVGKPEGYHAQIMKLKQEKMLAMFGVKQTLVTRVGRWGTVRYND